jgi:hypothetical protein
MKEYKIVIYREGVLGNALLGASNVNPIKFSDFLNEHASQGWRVVTIEKETRRAFVIVPQEAFIIVMEKDI